MDARRFRRGYDWNGYEVYMPVYHRHVCIGEPLVIFVNGDNVWQASKEEGYAYLSYWIERKDLLKSALRTLIGNIVLA